VTKDGGAVADVLVAFPPALAAGEPLFARLKAAR
jgi:hypothetical protein